MKPLPVGVGLQTDLVGVNRSLFNAPGHVACELCRGIEQKKYALTLQIGGDATGVAMKVPDRDAGVLEPFA